MLGKTSLSAIRAILLLAQQEAGSCWSPRKLAETLEESPTYMAEVVRHLVKYGVFEAEKGVKGGVRLVRSPEMITLLPVPGLANLATPSFPDVDRFDSRELIDTKIREGSLPASARVDTAGVPRQARNYFWYRRTFRLPAQRQVAILRINKAQFGTAVWVNGENVGEHLGCFSAGLFDVSGLVNWSGDNILVVRIGAHPAALPVWAPAGTDFEKYKWTPGIYDSVTIALADNPFIESEQVAPRISTSEAVIQTVLRNTGKTTVTSSLAHSVKLWKQTQVVARSPAQPLTLAPGERRTFTTSIRIPSPQLWTPETPFLYVVESATTGDSQSTRFGMREFLFETATKRAYLNRKLYFLRGSNITLHRFFEDPECRRRPWDEQWVRKLLVDLPKRMRWNSFRFCIGPVPDQWFDIADEAGLLIQNEFFIWNGRSRFPKWSTEELLTQYRGWMRDHWNHPSVAIWDACNETDAEVLRDVVIPSVRTLDLSNRPWENGYATPSGPDDPVEDHPYLFSALQRGGGSFQMTQLEGMTGAKTTNAGHPSGHAVVANEYGWLWLNRDGTPTTLTDKVYEKLLGKEAEPGQRFETYAYLLAGLTEFWRAHRNFAGVLHFTSLTCSYPGVKTSDHFRDVATLELEPNFADYVREAFRPLGLYINFWQPKLATGAKRTYAVRWSMTSPGLGQALFLSCLSAAARPRRRPSFPSPYRPMDSKPGRLASKVHPNRALRSSRPSPFQTAANPPFAAEKWKSSAIEMKITKVEAFVIRHPRGQEVIDAPAPGTTRGGPGLWNRLDDYATAYPKGAIQATLVKITTASGLVGWGQCHSPVAPRIHQAVVQDMLAPLLLGQDARDVEVLFDRLYASQRLRAYQSGPLTQTLAGVDLALWDLLGKHAGVPVCQLLGGIFRDRLPLYLWIRGNSPQSVAEATRQAVARGYSAVKMNVAGVHQIDLVAAASQAMGNRGQVLVVCVGLKLYEAIRIGRELDKLGNIGWLQEPLLPEDHTGYVKLAAAVETPICHGAFFGTRFRARDVLASKGADILNPDICYCGGLTETRRITILADAYGVLWSPHISMATPLLIAASLHLAAASPNFAVMESAGQESGPFGNTLLKQPLLVEQGYAAVPERPGLGVEFDDEALGRLRVS